jgi:hypothetical protein
MADLFDFLRPGSAKDAPARRVPARVREPAATHTVPLPTRNPKREPAATDGVPVPTRRPVYDEYLGMKPDLDHLRYSRADLREHVKEWGTARKELEAAYNILSGDQMECWNKPGELRPIVYPEIFDEHRTTIDWVHHRVAGGYAVAIATHDVLQAILVKFDKAIEQIRADAQRVLPERAQ